MDYLERGLGSDENNNNLLDKLQDAIGRGQNPISILPSNSVEPEIITIADTDVGTSGKFVMLLLIENCKRYKEKQIFQIVRVCYGVYFISFLWILRDRWHIHL